MALATQCPHCQTTFKVAHDQLKLRSGLVRCGSCKQIFNGIEHLVPPDRPTPPPAKHTAPPAPVDAPPKAATTLSAAAEIASKPADVQGVAPVSIDTLEFIPVDDPETQTRILSPAAEADTPTMPPATQAEVDDDPLTRMTLVDFTAFDEETDADKTPREDTPTDKPQAPDQSIWPDTQGGLHDGGELPSDMAPEAISSHGQGADATVEEPKQAPGFEEQDAATGQDAGIDTEPAAAAAGESADSLSGTITPVAYLVDEEDIDDEEPAFVRKGRRRQRWGRLAHAVVALASVLLLVAALGQIAYAFRDQLAARFPSFKPALVALCDLARCQVTLPAQIEQVSIESNELQAQANNKNVFTLSLLLHNRSAVAQAWPHVELTLNDKDGKPLVRRTLSPREYLPSDKLLPQGIPARSEQSVAVSFELSQLQASDYRVYLFYP